MGNVLGPLLGGSSSAEREAARAADEQARIMRENAERDRQQALQAQVQAQQQQEALAARQRAQEQAAALLTQDMQQAPDVALDEEPTLDIDPETGRRRRTRDAFQAPRESSSGIKL